MAEIATIARPYAEALFQGDRQPIGRYVCLLEEFAAIAANPQLQEFANNPTTTQTQVFELITAWPRRPCLPPPRTS